jgi:hypothetical protein
MANDLIDEIKSLQKGMRKANVDVFPSQLTLTCKHFEIRSDGDLRHTRVFIDGKPAKGIYSAHIIYNSQRRTKIELGLWEDEFEFELKPRRE